MTRAAKVATDAPAVTREEFEALRDQLREASELIRDLHGALMVAQPGHARSLLDRMAAVTIAIEGGDRSAKALVRAASTIVVVGGAVAAVYGALRFGSSTPN